MTKVAFLGLGRMGHGMAGRYLDSGFEVALWNRSNAQERRFEAWLSGLEDARLVVVECGAGDAIPTVRRMSENLQRAGADLIRINPREPNGPHGTISLPVGALEALSCT